MRPLGSADECLVLRLRLRDRGGGYRHCAGVGFVEMEEAVSERDFEEERFNENLLHDDGPTVWEMQNEAYLEWCKNEYLDPEDAESAARYEDYFDALMSDEDYR